ncbi:hypothetical protein GDO78_012982 [Eleutherodactylus coqui]|uniref:Thrombospondin-like N-terminal domain-containing protein n=1 Tax=Eleutherodactylus coqui TaxID=57060 RepID=A0A8J6K3T5_ELECQ|nr:hypothetical protein GDO78_012982 [Eleutherodactylus coqui]
MEPVSDPGSTIRAARGRSLFLWILFYVSCCLDISQGAAEDVDVLQKLGLMGSKPSSRPIPEGVIPFKSGVILTQRARIEAPIYSVIPLSLGTNLTLVLSLCSHRINNAFLFAVRSKKKKLELGLQFIPGKIIVYVGHKQSVYFDYNVHDGQWHNMAIDIQGQKVTLYTSCGKQRVNASLHIKKDDTLDSAGVFMLGKLNQQTIQFEGAICQFDIYPSAKAAHNYCKYLKKQCRQADTYRPNLPPLIPLLPLQAILPPAQEVLKSVGHLSTVAPQTELNRTNLTTNAKVKIPSVKLTTKMPTLQPSTSPTLRKADTQLSSSVLTRTATVALRISTSSSSPQLSVTKLGASFGLNATKTKKVPSEKITKPTFYQKTTIRPPATTASSKQVKKSTGKPRTTNTTIPKQALEKITSPPTPKPHAIGPKVYSTATAIPYTKPGSGFHHLSSSFTSIPVTYDYLWLDPTAFPYLMGPPGPKGDQGAPVSGSIVFSYV